MSDWNDVRSRIGKTIPKEEIEKLISQKDQKPNVEEVGQIDQPQPLEFLILKNIATDISGFAIVNGIQVYVSLWQ